MRRDDSSPTDRILIRARGWSVAMRHRLACARLVTERWTLSRRPPKRDDRARILCYHSFGSANWDPNRVTGRQVREHMTLIRDQGRRLVPLRELVEQREPGTVAITIDDGWRSTAEIAAPVLAELGVPWALFVVTGWVGRSPAHAPEPALTWDELVSLRDDGVLIGSHSVEHPDFATITPAHARGELARSRDTLQRELGVDATDFAIPFGTSRSWTSVAQRLALEVGYERVYAQSEAMRSPGTIGRSFVGGYDDSRVVTAVLDGALDHWEEWF